MSIEDAIREIVQDMVKAEVAAQLADIVKKAKMNAPAVEAPVAEAAADNAAAEMPKPRRGRRPNGEKAPSSRPAVKIISEAAKQAIGTFAIGEKIQYKQGKGTFEAVITGINVDTCEITFTRPQSDKYAEKTDVRTADKIYKIAAAPAAAEPAPVAPAAPQAEG